MNKCKICSNSENNHLLRSKEMMFGTKEVFNFLECNNCGCVQLMDELEDISKYYSNENYYSFNEHKTKGGLSKLKDYIIFCTAKYFYNGRDIFGFIFRKKFFFKYQWYKLLREYSHKSKILDVGCGNGEHLTNFSKFGFSNLFGVDPFIKEDIINNQFKILKKTIFEIEDKFDLIMLNHSFEHMNNPLEVIVKLSSILAENGKIMIRIPVADSYAYRKYKNMWYQLDPPRHYFIHTVQSMTILCEKANVVLNEVIYDSNENQFLLSEKYIRNISIMDKFNVSKQKVSKWQKESKKLNNLHDGDQACFIITNK
jgi:SAM-dependent methyltransferase